MKNTPSHVLTPNLWRLSIIGEIIHRHPEDHRPMAERLQELADKTWIRPDGTSCQLSPETLRKWYARFQAGGLAGLEDTRTTVGTRIPDSLADALISLRRAHPHWSVKLLLDEIRKSLIWNGRQPCAASLYRWCKAKGLLRSRKPDLATRRPFEFTTFGGLWVSDFLHGPRVTINGRPRKTYLLAILDDASRFVVSARFHLAESVEVLLTDLRQSLMRFGVPQRFYTDNGAAFRSRLLHQVGQRLGFSLPHTPPYQPEGRGKVERFFLTVREQFLAAVEAKTIDHLNRRLQEWVATHIQTPHRGIDGETPLQKRLRITDACRPLPATANIDGLFMQQRLCRVYRNGTFTIAGRPFEAPKAQPGGRTEVFFLPWNLEQVYYTAERIPAIPLNKNENAHRFGRSSPKENTHE